MRESMEVVFPPTFSIYYHNLIFFSLGIWNSWIFHCFIKKKDKRVKGYISVFKRSNLDNLKSFLTFFKKVIPAGDS
ncbi:MAG: hypothetical protein EA412_14545 [Chitinophagaceae bacterium]|nr:MAG: hypothetical protein EA412_14545 [Chitinophagaceae bacterium]